MILGAALLCCLAASEGLAAGGSLDPPPGQPGETMKSLQEIEARVPIDSLPITISESGSYYLTRNFSELDAQAAIEIASGEHNVTLDFNGFTISSASSSSNSIGIIVLNSGFTVIKNGFIQGQTTVSVGAASDNPGTGKDEREWTVAPAGFRNAIFASLTSGRLLIENMGISGCRNHGLWLHQASNVIVRDCLVESNGAAGINARNAVIQSVSSMRNLSHGFLLNHSVLQGSNAHENGGNGVSAFSSVIKDSKATYNGGNGFLVDSGTIAFCYVTGHDVLGKGADAYDLTNVTEMGNHPLP